MQGGGALPTRVTRYAESLALEEEGTHYVLLAAGAASLRTAVGEFPLVAGMVAAVPGAATLTGGAGLVVTRLRYQGLFQLAGPHEEHGRLRYIDGCTDSVLIAPPRRGDPCVNHLHLPPGTRQSEHHHPSLRAGIIARGEGRCVTPAGSLPLSAGQCFVLREGVRHGFHTDRSSLDVLVVHPDSDTGPTDEDHPMRNRTFLEAHPRQALPSTDEALP